MERELMKTLKRWQQSSEHLPLLVRGARQIGKSYLIEQFGETCFDKLIKIDFELSPEYQTCFSTLKPLDIIKRIEVLAQQTVSSGNTLLF